MSNDPTEALKEVIQSHASLRDEVRAVLDHQRKALASDEEACDALKTYVLGQMYGALRQTDPMRAAVEEAEKARDLGWWWLLYELGWKASSAVEDLPF